MKAKHYEAIAKAIKENTIYDISDAFTDAFTLNKFTFINALCDILKSENTHFDEVKFRELLK